MKLNRENLLSRTRQGLHIYAYILRQYQPSEELYLEGQRCRVTWNPFNAHRRSLQIELRDGLAVHRDLQWPEFTGDAFDFANQHLKCATTEALYFLLNQVMHLGLKVAAEDELESLEGLDRTWIPRVSFFKPPISNTLPSAQLSLREVHELITGDTYKLATEKLRQLTDASAIRNFKATRLPYVTFGGTFSKRSDKQLAHPSQLLVFDFDNLPLLEEVKHQLLTDRFLPTELLFTSPSGKGLKWIIRRDPTSTHHDYFRAVAHYLQRNYGLEVDRSGADVSRACFLAKDSSAFLNERHCGEREFENLAI